MRYRVVSGSLTGRVAPVYVEPAVTHRRCNLCGASSTAGKKTLRLSFQLRFPEDAYPTESAKRVFFYYGQRNRSDRPPAALRLAAIWRGLRPRHLRAAPRPVVEPLPIARSVALASPA